ncbi:unnamed protein product [Gadus morhua 'NCC']
MCIGVGTAGWRCCLELGCALWGGRRTSGGRQVTAWDPNCTRGQMTDSNFPTGVPSTGKAEGRMTDSFPLSSAQWELIRKAQMPDRSDQFSTVDSSNCSQWSLYDRQSTSPSGDHHCTRGPTSQPDGQPNHSRPHTPPRFQAQHKTTPHHNTTTAK